MATVEEGSLNKAAIRLHLSQPSLSRQIRDLESRLGVDLLRRSPSGVSPSLAGRELYRQATRLLEKMGGLVQAVQCSSSGVLKLGFLPAFLVGPVSEALSWMGAQRGEIRLQLVEATPGEQLDRLRSGDLDVAFLGSYDGPELTDLELQPLHLVPMRVVLPGGHRLARQPGIELTDLRDETFLGLDDRLFPGRNRLLQNACREAGFEVNFASLADGLVSLLTLVGLSQGVTLMPACAAVLPHPNCVFRPLQGADYALQFQVALRRGERRASVRELVDRCQEQVRRRSPDALWEPAGAGL